MDKRNPSNSPLLESLTGVAQAVGRFLDRAASAAVEHGPEVLAGLAGLRVETEHFQLLQEEWSNHPLLDFIMWQEALTGHTMALTLPQDALAGHAALARLLEPVCTAKPVVDELKRLAQAPELAGWSADEFSHGLEHVKKGELARAVAPLTIGLEGLIRVSAIKRGVLTEAEADGLRSASELVKRLWGKSGHYEPYMRRWVFGMANVYRHGGDRGAPAEQALHAVCGAAIWAKRVLEEPVAFETIERGVAEQVSEQYSRGALQIQPEAEARLRKAAAAADRSESTQTLLTLREQLLELREQRQGTGRTSVRQPATRALGSAQERQARCPPAGRRPRVGH